MTNGDMKGQVDALIGSFNDLGDLKYLAFLAAWIVAKCVCIDFFTLVLALSSGILFGGIGEGALASVASSSIASSVPFFLSRYKFRELAQIEINKRPTWRAVDKACSKDGFKTVFVLRLSPLLPIPIGKTLLLCSTLFRFLYQITLNQNNFDNCRYVQLFIWCHICLFFGLFSWINSGLGETLSPGLIFGSLWEEYHGW